MPLANGNQTKDDCRKECVKEEFRVAFCGIKVTVQTAFHELSLRYFEAPSFATTFLHVLEVSVLNPDIQQAGKRKGCFLLLV